MKLPVIVDGSITPEQIPDSLAYRHFFAAIAAHPFPAVTEQARQTAQLSQLNLPATDRQTLITGLASFRTQLDQIESARGAVTPGPAAAAQLAALNTQTDNLVATTLQAVRRSLTVYGWNLLDAYVKARVKGHIRIYGATH
jgi:2-methylisocitrate lyase-like PEP mutase family enzyme